MNFKKHYLSIFATILLSNSAHATYTCQGSVVGVQISPTGVVSAASIAGLPWPQICSLETTAPNGVAPATCRSILALLLTAQSTQKNVTLWFSDDPASSCATHANGAWSYLMGWYYGPELGS